MFSRAPRSADHRKHIQRETSGQGDKVLFSCLVSSGRHLRAYRWLKTRHRTADYCFR